MSATTEVNWDALKVDLLRPGSDGYEQSRKPAVTRFHESRPLAVARCATGADVAEVIRFARAHRLPAVVRGGGHSFAGTSVTTGIVIDVSAMNSVRLGTDNQARIGGGTLQGTIYRELGRQGRTIPAGCGPTVGIAGLTLGGGLGLLGRRHGLTCDQLTGATVVLADGTVVEATEQDNTDLLWALRGGGHGTVGVVTELTFRTVETPVMTAFRLEWPHTQAADVIVAWQDWSTPGPAELSASLLAIAGRQPRVYVRGVYLGDRAAADRHVAALVARTGSYPARVEGAELPYLAAKDFQSDAGREPAEFIRSEYFARPLPPDVVRELVSNLYSDSGEYRELDFMPWGGAYNRLKADATAFPHRNAQMLIKHAATGSTDWLTRSWKITHPWGIGGVYPNFPEPGVDEGAYYGTNLARLHQVMAKYDPDGFFPRKT